MGLKTVYLTTAARIHRRRRNGVSWIGVTGSSGKTTLSVMLCAILETRGAVRDGSVVREGNTVKRLAATILGARPYHQFCVAEISGWAPGSIRLQANILRPAVGIVTNVGNDHRSNFKSLDNTAREKGQLIEALPEKGVAILNTDDPRVWAMRRRTRAQVIGYGSSPQATLRLLSSTSAWPGRLALTVGWGNEKYQVKSQFVGPYATTAILAAIAAGSAVGIPIAEVIAAIETVEPQEGRMRPYETDRGVTLIDDSWKCPIDSVPAALSFLDEAKAGRKIIVFGEISDASGAKGARYRQVARQALEVADVVIYVGHWASSIRKLENSVDPGRIRWFDSIGPAAAFLEGLLRSGDLMLLKGSQRADHLERLIIRNFQPVRCWRDRCGLFVRCVDCNLIDVPEQPVPAPSS